MKTTALLSLVAFTIAIHAGENWTEFRGPSGDGHSDAKGLVSQMGEGTNVKWRTPIHGKSWSSPVVWGGQVWLSTATEDGTELGVMVMDAATGKVLHDKKLFTVEKPQFCHKFNSYASPTPVIEEGRIYVSWGSPAIACLDTKTCTVLWERRDFVCNHYRAAGSSPILWKNLMILPFDGSDHQFIAALDKATGKTVWNVQRSIDFKDLQPDGKPDSEGDYRKSFGTPIIIEQDGKPMLISHGAKAAYAYEPGTGKEIWRFEERACHSSAVRPVAGEGMVFLVPGYGVKQVIALKPGGSGLLDESAVAWREKKAAPNKPSPIFDKGLLFVLDDNGMASCLDAKTGAMKWRERIGGNYSASPILADGRIYFFSEEGKAVVVAAAPEFKKIAEGKFDDGFMASPAVSGKALFLRTRTALYRVEE